MGICDLIDIRFSQFRAFKAVVKEGCLGAGILYRDIQQEGPRLIDKIGKEDILLIPPYGAFINRMRNEKLSFPNVALLIDLKGPMGIDTFLQLYHKKHALKLHYCSTMLGEVQYRDSFEVLARIQALCHPLPFFPHPNQIEQVGILEHFKPKTSPLSMGTKIQHIFFAGAVWGYREQCLNALRAHNLPICVQVDLSPQEYWNALRQSAVALDIGGGQAHTYRFHEIYLANSCCISEYRPLFFTSSPPQDLEEIVWFRSIPELIDRARTLLQTPELLHHITHNGSQWYRNTQSPVKLVEYLMNIGNNQAPSLLPILESNRYYYNLNSQIRGHT